MEVGVGRRGRKEGYVREMEEEKGGKEESSGRERERGREGKTERRGQSFFRLLGSCPKNDTC